MEVEQLSVDNILGESEIENLFTPMEESKQESSPESEDKDETDDKENNQTTEVNPDNLFEQPESVGSENEDKKVKENTSETEVSTSPKNFYSSIAEAFVEDGIFPNLNNEQISKIQSPEDFRDVVEQQIRDSLDERQKRIDEALNYKMEPSVIKQYEATISYLDNLDENTLTEESEEGEKLRKQLIFQDFINRGFSQERAQREAQKSLDNGTDIEDAKDALQGNRDYFSSQYSEAIQEAKDKEEQLKKAREKDAVQLKESIMNGKVIGDLSLDKNTRQKIYESLTKPVYRDPDTGTYYTEIQKYEKDNRLDFAKNLAIVYNLTNGFKNLDKLVKDKVKKETRKGLRELEHTINNTSRNADGSLKFASGVSADPDSIISKGWKLDL